MSDHKSLKRGAQDAIADLAGDTSVSPQQTLDSLEELAADISTRVDAIREDMRRDTQDA